MTATSIDSTLNLALPTASGQRVKPRIIGVVRDIRYSGLDTPAQVACTCRGSRFRCDQGFSSSEPRVILRR